MSSCKEEVLRKSVEAAALSTQLQACDASAAELLADARDQLARANRLQRELEEERAARAEAEAHAAAAEVEARAAAAQARSEQAGAHDAATLQQALQKVLQLQDQLEEAHEELHRLQDSGGTQVRWKEGGQQ